MDNFEHLTLTQLLWRKTLGCFQMFGLRETLCRMVKELKRFRKSNKDPLDISFVTMNLAIGAAPKSLAAMQQIIDLKINHILDLRAERKKTDILSHFKDVDVSWVPIYDDWQPKPIEFFRKLLDEIKRIEKNSKLFICCGAGEHRAPLAGIMALLTEGYVFGEATQMIHKARPAAEFLSVYELSLKTFLTEHKDVL
jgi:hypothetical protein